MAVDKHDGVYRPCCINQDMRWATYRSLQQYWQSETLHTLRHNLSTGIRDVSCNRCWQLEDIGQCSMRKAVSQDQARLNAIRSPAQIKQVKLITGATCNLSCMMCFPGVSSTYQKLWQQDYPWNVAQYRLRPREYDDEMDAYIRQNAQQIEFIEVLGGESLFNKNFFDLLTFLVESDACRHMTLFVITNGTLFTKKIQKLLSKFKKTVLTVSVDGIGPVNDYQRWPSRWSEISLNLSKINDVFDMSILPTVTAVNIIGLPRLVDFCQNHGYVLRNINLVEGWPQLLPCNLPRRLAVMVSDEFRAFLDGDSDPASLIDFVLRWDNKRQIRIQDYMSEWQNVDLKQ